MGPLLRQPLLQGADWWYESWGLSDWFETLFNQPLEVHAFLLGGFIGMTLGALVVRNHMRTALTLTLVVVLFTFGTFETAIFCSDEFGACQHVRLKPWYFIGGFLTGQLLLQGVGKYFSDAVTDNESENHPETKALGEDVATPLSGLIIAVLLGFAVYSFVAPEPAQPITGLATIGGFLGSVLGLAAYEWARAAIDSQPTFLDSLQYVLADNRAESILAIGYGTVLGFGYPRLFWEFGRLSGRNTFLFGSIRWARNGLPSVVAYVFGLGVLTTLFIWVRSRITDTVRFDGNRVAALVLGFVTYTFWLFVSTGYAGTIWFRVIPSA